MDSEQNKPMRLTHIRDARGRKVTQLDPVAMHLLRRHDVIEAETLRAIAGEKGVRITAWERASLIVGVLALLAVGGLFITELVLGGLTDAPYAKHASVAFFSLMPWVIWFSIKRSRFGKVAAAMLRHGRCPHCGYDLKNLTIDGKDGATICPECGCAWKLSDEATKRRSNGATEGVVPADEYPRERTTGMSEQERRTKPSMHIRDARGRKVTQLDPVMMHMLRRHDVIEANVLRAIAEEIGPGYRRASRIAGWTFFILGAGGMTTMLVRAYLFRGGLDTVGKILTLVNIICLALFMLGIWTGARKLRFHRIKRAMLKHRRCPHCGYDLKGLPVDESDGATICPECGCAWKLSDEATERRSDEGNDGRG